MGYCEEKKDKLMDLALGELDGADRVELEMHLSACPGCRERLEQDRAIIGALKGVTLPEPRAEFMEGLSDRVFQEFTASKASPETDRVVHFRPVWHGRLKLLAVAASLMLLLLGKIVMKVDGPGKLPPGAPATISSVIENFPLEMDSVADATDAAQDEYFELDEMFMGEDAEQFADLEWTSEDIAVESYDMYDYLENISDEEAEDLLMMLESGETQS